MMRDPVALTEDLVAYDTVSARPNAPLIGRLATLLEPLDGRLQRVVSPHDPEQINLVARFGPDGPGGLAFAGHTDTVPWDGSMRATTAPERDGRRLYGRGTCDMKGAIAAMIHAAHAVGRDGLSKLKRPLWFALTFQEEVGCHGAKLLQTAHPLPVDHTIIGEPTGLTPVTLHKGYAIAQVKMTGQPCHSSDPRQGASAVHGAARAVEALLELGQGWQAQADDRFTPPWTTINVGLISGGEARNIVPERAEFTVEFRPLPGTDVAATMEEIEAVARRAAQSVPGASPLGVAMEVVEVNQPLFTPDDAPLTQWLVEQTGAVPGSVPFYTEGALFNAMGGQTVVCGPGEIAQAHRVDEWVELDALEQAAGLYRRAIEQFCT